MRFLSLLLFILKLLTTTRNEHSGISRNSHYYTWIFLCGPVGKLQMLPHIVLCSLHLFVHVKNACSFHHLVQSKYTLKWNDKKFHLQAVMFSIFVCACVYADYLFDLHKKFEAASTHDTNIEYQIWCFWYNLFWSYADNRHSYAQTNHWKGDFQIQGTSKRVNPSKSQFRKFITKTIFFPPCMGKRKY